MHQENEQVLWEKKMKDLEAQRDTAAADVQKITAQLNQEKLQNKSRHARIDQLEIHVARLQALCADKAKAAKEMEELHKDFRQAYERLEASGYDAGENPLQDFETNCAQMTGKYRTKHSDCGAPEVQKKCATSAREQSISHSTSPSRRRKRRHVETINQESYARNDSRLQKNRRRNSNTARHQEHKMRTKGFDDRGLEYVDNDVTRKSEEKRTSEKQHAEKILTSVANNRPVRPDIFNLRRMSHGQRR